MIHKKRFFSANITEDTYKWSNHSLQLRGRSKWSRFCPGIEATATTSSGTHIQGREARQTGISSLSEATFTPGEAERSVIVQAPVLTLHLHSASCFWLSVSPSSSFRSKHRNGLVHIFQCSSCSKASPAKFGVLTESVLPVLLRYRTKHLSLSFIYM